MLHNQYTYKILIADLALSMEFLDSSTSNSQKMISFNAAKTFEPNVRLL